MSTQKTMRVRAHVTLNEKDYHYYIKKCWLCFHEYNKLFGENMTGDVVFTLRKVKKSKKTCFCFHANALCHAKNMSYVKALSILEHGFDIDKICKWAGDDMFTITAKKQK